MKRSTLTLCEGAICIALAIALSYFEIEIGVLGGSIGFAMIPLIIFAVHRGGAVWGILAGIVFGTLKFILTGESVINWQSLLLDYSIAYGAVGLAGLFRGVKVQNYVCGAVIASVARFAIHFLSGVTIYAEYAPPESLDAGFWGIAGYSLIYNGTYMLPSAIAAIIIVPILGTVLDKALGKRRV
jgi:thiamine transporter